MPIFSARDIHGQHNANPMKHVTLTAKGTTSNPYIKTPSKQEEQQMKRIIKERHKIHNMLNEDLQFRENYLRAQHLTNAHMERSRLLGLQGRVMYNLRDVAPPVTLHARPDATDRLDQINQEIEHLSVPHRFDTHGTKGTIDMYEIFRSRYA